jgi:hypothetical protein
MILPALVFPGQTHIIMYLGGDLAPSSRRSIPVDIPMPGKAGRENDVSIVHSNKHSSLLRTFVNYGCKKFYNIGPRIPCKASVFVQYNESG